MYGRSLAILERAHGRGHDLVLETAASYAQVLRDLGRDAEAVALEDRISGARAEGGSGEAVSPSQ